MSVNQQPILIAGPPRSGTTMLAGLILVHENIWIGRARTTWFPGTNPEIAVENQDIKDIMKRIAAKIGYRNWQTPLPEQPKNWNGLKEEIEALVPNDRRWLVKTSWLLTFDEFWRWAYPDALWVMPWRRVESILDSTQRHMGMRHRPENMRKKFIWALRERQAQIMPKIKQVHSVDVYNVSNNIKEDIETFLTFVGITPDQDKINGWIQPGRMKK